MERERKIQTNNSLNVLFFPTKRKKHIHKQTNHKRKKLFHPRLNTDREKKILFTPRTSSERENVDGRIFHVIPYNCVLQEF